MPLLGYIILFSFIGSIVSLIGGMTLLIRQKFTITVSHYLSSFAAGALLGTAFFDLLPEAAEAVTGESDIFLWVIIGLLAFFLLERFIHHHDQGNHPQDHKAVVPMIVAGDTIHNFIDGVAIAAAFLINIPLGIITALAVAIHEIPQEIGDFGLLIHKGVSRQRIIFINFFSAAAAMLGAILTYFVKDSIEGILPVVLSLTAGFFIYIAVANLIPEIHNNENKKIALWETFMLLLGVGAVWAMISLLEGKI